MKTQLSPFKQSIYGIEKQIHKIQSVFNTMKILTDQGLISDANEVSFELSDECEKLTLQARALPHYTGNPHAVRQMEQNILQSVPVKMQFTDENWFKLHIPALLPKKEHGSPEYIRGFLFPAMKCFFYDRPKLRFPDCVIIFKHIYSRTRPERQYRDHDNIELNAVVDLIALFLLDGDMPLRCFHFYCSAAGDSDSTEIIVLPQMDFIKWTTFETECFGKNPLGCIGENFRQNEEIPNHEKPP